MTSAILGGLDLGTAQALRELGDVASALETAFLEAGNGLGDAVGCWQTISHTFGGLAGQFDRDDMRACIDTLAGAVAVAAALGADGGGDALIRLGALGEQLAAMRSRLTRLSRTIAEVKLVALNAKVEAAHLDERSTDFSVFTREIDRLACNAADELAVLEAEMRALAAQTADVYRVQAGFADSHGAELLALTRRLDDGLRTLTHQRQQVAEAATAIGEHSRQAGDRVGKAVMALQIGDITRQRTEHVVEALTVLAGLTGGPQSLSPEDARQATALVSALQSNQLEQTATDLEGKTAQVTSSLTGLAGETESITRLGHDSFGSEDSSFLTGLGREIAQVEQLLEDYAAALARTGEAMAAVAAGTAAMVAHVEAIHSIEADLKIMALNASFKCARLGDRGRTLSVVAQSLRQLANRTVEDAGVLMSGLQAAMATAQALAHGQPGEEGSPSVGGAVTGLREVAQVLAAAGAEQAAALAVLETDSLRAQTLLRATAAGIAVSGGFANRLRAVAANLARIAAATPVETARAEQLKDLVLSRLSGNYTMASERALHGLFDGDTAQAATAAAEVDVDDLLF